MYYGFSRFSFHNIIFFPFSTEFVAIFFLIFIKNAYNIVFNLV